MRSFSIEWEAAEDTFSVHNYYKKNTVMTIVVNYQFKLNISPWINNFSHNLSKILLSISSKLDSKINLNFDFKLLYSTYIIFQKVVHAHLCQVQ